MNRLTHAIQSLSLGDHESALLDIVILIDRSAKILYGGNKVGKRFRKLLYDKQALIFWLFTQGQLATDGHEIHFVSDSGANTTLPDLIYSSLRTALVHEAQLPKDIRITADPGVGWFIGYKNGVFLFPQSLVAVLLLMLISLPFNIRYKEFTTLTLFNVSDFGTRLSVR